MDEVTRLLERLKLIDFCNNLEENKIDGPTLMYCKSEDDVKELGIDITAKARMLYEDIVKFKSNGVPLALFSKVPVIINFDDLTSVVSDFTYDNIHDTAIKSMNGHHRSKDIREIDGDIEGDK